MSMDETWKEKLTAYKKRQANALRILEVMREIEQQKGPPCDDLGLGHLTWRPERSDPPQPYKEASVDASVWHGGNVQFRVSNKTVVEWGTLATRGGWMVSTDLAVCVRAFLTALVGS